MIIICTCRSSTVFCNPNEKKVGGLQVSTIYLTSESITVLQMIFVRDLDVESYITHSKKVLKSELFSQGQQKMWAILIFPRRWEILVFLRNYWYFLGNTEQRYMLCTSY